MSVHAKTTSPAPASWQRQYAEAVRDPRELLQLLDLPADLLPAARRAAGLFPLRVPRAFIARMQPGRSDDPLLRQVLPLDAEFDEAPGFVADPVGDLAAHGGAGVLHKYHGRALLITTGACAVHCRYCFRRHYPYPEAQSSRSQWQPALDYLRTHPEIQEIILSGGDPLSLSDQRFGELLRELEALPQLRRLRIHSRLPVVLPDRVNETLLGQLRESRLRSVVVIHANHAAELDPSVARAVAALGEAGAMLLNQAVLLQGVNDTLEAQCALSERLFDIGVLPYYLHLLDRVRGARHFDLPEARAVALWRQMAARLPGYLLPRLVREISGEPNKTLLAPTPTPQS
ncbi:EF-P beta-lysylation protein EpmB [Alkalilimnicola sp. S0819]|uniref:EF-P beta-lysylation protein EpmB n=1 Tax=Alkalilimnicola sp. S0819 TaxID=2613922 RepID=UPI001261E821|nr:EF-P beta-lysylation protein EpmB [Alkalilimnicola sp. S0819]KAB7627833.1 EF-P beta-lysylation protein EpmB [Alkalilimnicola sp. S0819]MPQ15465.1 EF-P beta-lysylation protein EpmB [Alkalilimnicola sp. S0819]